MKFVVAKHSEAFDLEIQTADYRVRVCSAKKRRSGKTNVDSGSSPGFNNPRGSVAFGGSTLYRHRTPGGVDDRIRFTCRGLAGDL